MPTIEELQKTLEHEIAALAEKRKEEAERIEREATLRKQEEEIERQQRVEDYKKNQDKLRRQKQEAEERVKEQQREQARQQAEIDRAKDAALAAKAEQEKSLEELRIKLANEEFVEEQHRKRIETLKTPTPHIVFEEHPEAPTNVEHPGDAVAGTGGLEEGPEMSQHLRKILRQG